MEFHSVVVSRSRREASLALMPRSFVLFADRRSSVSGLLTVLFAVLVGGLLVPREGKASAASEYCFQTACFATLAEAERALRATSINAARMIRTRVVINSLGQATLTYEVPPIEPDRVSPAVYAMPDADSLRGICHGSNPMLDHMCDSERDAVDAWLTTDPFKYSSAQIDPAYWMASDYLPRAQAIKAYLSDANGIHHGIVRFEGLRGGGRVDDPHPSLPSRLAMFNEYSSLGHKYLFYTVQKVVTFSCPAGYHVMQDVPSQYLVAESELGSVKFCLNNESLSIISRCGPSSWPNAATGQCQAKPNNLGPCECPPGMDTQVGHMHHGPGQRKFAADDSSVAKRGAEESGGDNFGKVSVLRRVHLAGEGRTMRGLLAGEGGLNGRASLLPRRLSWLG